MDGIFISYRREDSAGYAGRLYDRLAAHFGADRVFMDVEGIEPGVDFVTAIEQAVASCRVLIVLIGDQWLTVTDESGRRRLDDPQDFIRLETGTALGRQIRVVPVLVNDAPMPRMEDLPSDLKSLARRQAIAINHKQWEATTGDLIQTLERIFASNPAKPSESGVAPTANKNFGGTTEVPRDQGASGHARQLGWAAGILLLIAGLVTWQWPRGDKTRSEMETRPAGTGPAIAENKAASLPPPAVGADAGTPTPPVVAAPPKAIPMPAPKIADFTAEPGSGRVRLCYRIEGASSASLTPAPGNLKKMEHDCVVVTLESSSTFTLTARNAEGTATEKLEVMPLPVPAVATPTAPVRRAAIEPPRAVKAVPATPVTASPLPVRGESWTYQTHGIWPTSPKRTIRFTIESADPAVVQESFTQITPDSRWSGEKQQRQGGKPGFATWGELGNEFTPFLAAYHTWNGEENWTGIDTPSMDVAWSNWFTTAKTLGQGTVAVPAGSFEAWKVEVWSSRRATGGPTQADVEPTRVHYLVWYAPKVKRYLRMQRTIISANGKTLEDDVFELSAYRNP